MKKHTRDFSKLVKIASQDKEINSYINLYEKSYISFFGFVDIIREWYEDHPEEKEKYLNS